MNNKTTWILSGIVIIICVIIGIGYFTSIPQKQPVTTQPAPDPLPSRQVLDEKLIQEQPAISSAIKAKFPDIDALYVIERAKLYDRGQWFGAILQYKGSDSLNRDTLRIVLLKKSNAWQIQTNPPQPLVNTIDIPNAPKAMIDDLNRPASLTGTESSPTIIPNE